MKPTLDREKQLEHVMKCMFSKRKLGMKLFQGRQKSSEAQ